ncbi:MAG: hypothetical protein ACOYUZ_03425 [Patescibacteria group bacterium]
MEIEEMSNEELKNALKQIFAEGHPGGDICGAVRGDGFATGEHLQAICLVKEALRRGYANYGMKHSIMAFIAEFVNDEYSARVLSFTLSGYRGDDLSTEEWSEVAEAMQAKLASPT